MSAQDQDDLFPRPSPKPSPVEIISVQPEVPEASLILNPNLNGMKNTHPKVSDFVKQSSNKNNAEKNYIFDYARDNTYLRNDKSPETFRHAPMSPCYLPTSSQKQIDAHLTPKKVSFSPRHDKYGCLNVSDYNKPACRGESSTYRCTCKPQQRLEYDCSYPVENEICNVKRCLCANCSKQYHDPSSVNHSPREQKSNAVSSDELQKTILKFENLFLKLNYKYSKVTENFVSKEELNNVIQKYEARLDSMQKYVNELVESSKADMDKRVECNCTHKTERIRENKYENGPHEIMYPKWISDQKVGNSCNLRDHIQRIDARNTDQHCKLNKLVENESIQKSDRNLDQNCKVNRLVENELTQKNEPMFKHTEDDQQLKRMYNNIVLEVKNMMERNPMINAEKNVDPLHFIKKATLEQFRKMGINVENINEEERRAIYENEELKRKPPISTANAVPSSSDLSFHMNTLAMKYLPDNQSDSSDNGKKASSANDVSVNYNNISIATLQYLARYPPTTDKLTPYDNNNCEKIPPERRYRMYEYPSNDKSFIY